jgi:D-3-phosphoglycerate dehydrogenase
MAEKKAVIIDDRYENHDSEIQEFRKAGAGVVEIRTPNPTEDEILAACRDAEAIVVNLATLSGELLRKFEKCRVIARYGVGYDSIDVAAATEMGIRVVNVPDYCAEEVSDQALALFMACVRQIRYRDASVRRGEWDSAGAGPMYRIAGRKFGLVGYGNIPRVLHRKLKGFDLAEVLVYDPFVSAADVQAAGARQVDFDTLLSESDYISIHAPLNAKTRHLFGAAQFGKMKPTAILVNTSRGGLVDTEALAKALKGGEIAWAGLDVHETEPVPADYPLFGMENVVLSDHKGFYSEEAQADLQRKAAAYAAQVLLGQTPKSVVNKEVLG